MLLHHVTLNTGRVCVLPRPNLSAVVRAQVCGLIDGKAVYDWSVRFARRMPQGVTIFDVHYAGRLLAASWLCTDDGVSGYLWEMLCSRPDVLAPGVAQPKHVPWLAAAICVKDRDFVEDVGSFGMMLNVVPTVGEFGRFIAWELIDREMAGLGVR